MVDWNPSQPLPDQLANAFAALYDWLDAGPYETVENRVWKASIPLEPETIALRTLVGTSGWRMPPEFQPRLDTAAARGGEEPAREVYRCLVAIDRGVRRHHPTYASSGGVDEAANLLTQYDLYGRYNTDAVDGYVLPKWSARYRGTVLAEHCNHLVRVPGRRDRLSVIGRGHGAHRSRRLGNPTVAIVPFLYTLDDASFGPVDAAGEPYFKILHKVDAPNDLEGRVRSAVNAIRDSDANIAIFPELVLNQRLLDALRAHLKATVKPSSTLDWVIAGTAVAAPGERPFEVVNAAVMLNGAGQVVTGQSPDGTRQRWEQPKRHRYVMSADEQRRYGLESCFATAGKMRNREEAINIRRRAVVFDDRSGRYAVLICEDWGQEEETCAALRRFLPRVVFVIVMDGPMRESRWAAQRADDIITHTGAFVVLANSLLIPNLKSCRDHMADKHGVDDPVLVNGHQPVGLLYGPPGANPPNKPFPHRFEARALPVSDDNGSLVSNVVPIPLTPQ